MPKHTFPAAAEGTPNFNRRTILGGLALAPSITVPVVSAHANILDQNIRPAAAAPSLHAELQRLVQSLDEFLAERTAAQAEVDRIADEWCNRWPMAPEALLGPTISRTALDDDMWRAERDIAGNVLERDVSLLTKRLTKEQRAEFAGKKLAFYVWKRSNLVDRLEDLRQREPVGRTPKALARNRAWRSEAIAQAEARLNFVTTYDSETAHMREVSGINAAKARLAEAKANVTSVREAISNADARSPADLWKKAEVVREELQEHSYDLSELFPGSSMARLQRLAFATARA